MYRMNNQEVHASKFSLLSTLKLGSFARSKEDTADVMLRCVCMLHLGSVDGIRKYTRLIAHATRIIKVQMRLVRDALLITCDFWQAMWFGKRRTQGLG